MKLHPKLNSRRSPKCTRQFFLFFYIYILYSVCHFHFDIFVKRSSIYLYNCAVRENVQLQNTRGFQMTYFLIDVLSQIDPSSETTRFQKDVVRSHIGLDAKVLDT